MLLSWYRTRLPSGSQATPRHRRPVGRRRHIHRPRLEALEGRFTPTLVGTSSLIQSDYGGNFEAVILQGNNLVHYWRDQNCDWHFGEVITPYATGPGSLIQSRFKGDGVHGNLEVVVPEGNELVHYWRDSRAPGQWNFGAVITPYATGPATIIQSSFGIGNFEVLANEYPCVLHYWWDGSWHFGAGISCEGDPGASGDGAASGLGDIPQGRPGAEEVAPSPATTIVAGSVTATQDRGPFQARLRGRTGDFADTWFADGFEEAFAALVAG